MTPKIRNPDLARSPQGSQTRNSKGGFTLIELLVSVGIFVIMTGLLVAKYSNFNQSVLLTNLAYDVALTIRTAQTYGLSIKGVVGGDADSAFQHAYGVYLSTDSGKNKEMKLFASNTTNNDPYYDEGEGINTYSIKRGAIISRLCGGSGDNCPQPNNVDNLNISFKRPNPDAILCKLQGNACAGSYDYVEIELQGTDGGKRIVTVRKNGQISVKK